MKTGNETTHMFDGATIRGADIDRLVAGPNGAVTQYGIPNTIYPMAIPPGTGVIQLAVWTANHTRGVRAIVPRDGQIIEIAFFVSVTSGNIDLGIYDCTATTRARLAFLGSTACAGNNTWQSSTALTGFPLNVFRGQALDFVLAVDNATTQVAGITATNAALNQLPSTSWNPVFTDAAQSVVGVNTGKLAWDIAQAPGLPATLTEASLAATAGAPLIIARMAG